MTPKQALELVMKVTIQYKGTRQEHAMLQQAEQILSELVKPDKKPKK